jgi:hypothetical protein
MDVEAGRFSIELGTEVPTQWQELTTKQHSELDTITLAAVCILTN